MIRRRTMVLAAVALMGIVCLFLMRAAGPSKIEELVGPGTIWRIFLVDDHMLREAAGSVPFLPSSAGEWTRQNFDTSRWARYRGELSGGYGFNQSENQAALFLRTAFWVGEPERTELDELAVTYRGGAIVYVNGREITRSHLPAGGIDPSVEAEPYGEEAYFVTEGDAPLPRADRPAQAHAERYDARVRQLTAMIPSGALSNGLNVLAIEIHRAGRPDLSEAQRALLTDDTEWNRLGFYGVSLVCRRKVKISDAISPGGAKGRVRGETPALRVWNADPMEPIDIRSWRAEPGEPFRPMRLAGPRNGVCSAQVVLGAPEGGLGEVEASVGDLIAECRTPNAELRSLLPKNCAHVRYAVQEDGPYCDTLAETPPRGVRVLPVWLIVEVPRDQEPGIYRGQMTIRAGSHEVSVPVELEVCAWMLPDPRDYVSHVSLLESPDTLALKYGVEPWSDRHFELIEKSLELMGRVGNDVLYVPVVRYTHLGNNNGMIRFGRSEAEAVDYAADLSVFDRFLDLYAKHCGPPRVLCLEVWNHRIRDGAAPIVTQYDPRSSALSELEGPAYGSEGSVEFWKPMMDLVRERVLLRGWNERCIMVGVAGDRWPREKTVDFFRSIAPYARWAIFTHGRWKGTRDDGEDGRMFVANSMEIGYHEDPWGYGESRLVGEVDYKPWRRPYVKAGSLRECVEEWAHPVRYRNLADISVNSANQGFGRVGLDYWAVDGQPLIGLHENKGWDRLYRDNPRAVAAPGPDGALPTVRFLMLREGVQEAEARIVIAAALERDDAVSILGEDLVNRCRTLLEQRRLARMVAKGLPEAQISCGWSLMTSSLYDTAQAVAAAGR